MKEQMRTEFEAWAKDYSSDFDFTTTPSGTYIDHITYGAWVGYGAGLAALSAVPEKELTNKALESLGNSPEGFHASRMQHIKREDFYLSSAELSSNPLQLPSHKAVQERKKWKKKLATLRGTATKIGLAARYMSSIAMVK